ncbi:hypothetical protein [Chamaesiphon sp.]|uniref:hypothetical protein n=1 Tax=Chamaesiphon sp. TaxID=2814140 RepID=UPI0035946120
MVIFATGWGIGYLSTDSSLKVENASLRASMPGGLTAGEEREALKKREEDVIRRENNVNKRENDTEERLREFNSTVRSTGEEVGKATQLMKSQEDTKQLLIEVTIMKNLWSWGTMILIVGGLIATWFTYNYIRKLQYSKDSLERAMEILQGQLQNPSVTVEQVKAVFKTATQFIESEQSSKQKLLRSGSESEEYTT